jgi:hypothetical protein
MLAGGIGSSAVDVLAAETDDLRRHRRLTLAPSSGHRVGEMTADTQGTSSFSSGKFWASVDEQSEEEFQITSPSDVFIADAARNGFQAEDLIQAEHEIVATEKVCSASPSSVVFRCPKTRKIVNAVAKDRSLKQHGKPWKGSLPKPRISPSKTLGDAVIKKFLYETAWGPADSSIV